MKLAATLFLFVVSASAADVSIDLNPAQTKVLWTLGDVLHTVHGTFKLTRGTIHFDSATGKASGEIVVDATSGESGSGARDGRMHKNVLESAKYPTISFKPDHVEGAVNLNGDSQVQVHGVFAIHGGEHELTVPAKLHFASSQMNGTIDFLVPFVKWGMKDPSTMFLKVKDSVEIELQAAGSTTQ
jgi:polyisoprenoid-binding protein YceI